MAPLDDLQTKCQLRLRLSESDSWLKIVDVTWYGTFWNLEFGVTRLTSWQCASYFLTSAFDNAPSATSITTWYFAPSTNSDLVRWLWECVMWHQNRSSSKGMDCSMCTCWIPENGSHESWVMSMSHKSYEYVMIHDDIIIIYNLFIIYNNI